jgi:hypothetical protein
MSDASAEPGSPFTCLKALVAPIACHMKTAIGAMTACPAVNDKVIASSMLVRCELTEFSYRGLPNT